MDPDQQNNETSLLDDLAAQTEYKAPGDSSSAPAWKFEEGEDLEPDSEAADGDPGSATDKSSYAADAERIKKPKISEEVKKASAETAALLYGEVLQLICTPIVNVKFSRKFTEKEKEQVFEKNLEFAELDKLDEADQLLKKKWDLNLKKRDAKIKGIPLSSTEEKRVQTAFLNYFRVTDKALGPEWLLAFTLISITTDRAIDTFTD